VSVGRDWIRSVEAHSAPRQYPGWAPLLILGAGAAALNFLLPDFRLHLLSGWLVYGLLALSLAFVWGQVGIFSFGQPAFFGVGAYAYGIIAITYVDATGETVTALIGATLAGAWLAALLGYFMFYGRVARALYRGGSDVGPDISGRRGVDRRLQWASADTKDDPPRVTPRFNDTRAVLARSGYRSDSLFDIFLDNDATHGADLCRHQRERVASGIARL